MKCTRAQIDALYQVYLRWQDLTSHAIMPKDLEIVEDEEYGDGDYIGIWVGPYKECKERPDRKGAIFIGIEKDGHEHS
ncbi:hypothetical protein LCGC14_0344430 [marine sediment metagenome]|uniref:Uncharacterized protein n=1 Tax=marine sediment metagenome TaxID=412755 RepID=A0A0F9TVH9_9ZZZZ